MAPGSSPRALPFALAVLLALSAFSVEAEAFDSEDKDSLYQRDLVERINSNPRATWVAGYNDGLNGLPVWRLRGAYRNPPRGALPVKRHAGLNAISLPAHFDAREQWSHCPTIGQIRDQGHCGSCWAFGAVEALSDRFCIHLNESVALSTEDLLACCGDDCGDGCDGGWPYKAWVYFTRRGIVTESCEPYFDQTGCKHPGCEPVAPTPECVHECSDSENWASAKHFAASAYVLEPGNTVDIMQELYKNGPVEVDFDVFEDFTVYKSGVYEHLEGGIVGGHAVKLIGWGTTEDGVDYWLIANSWNKSWGEDGYFRIRRGTNECGIEDDAVAGIPGSQRKMPGVASE